MPKVEQGRFAYDQNDGFASRFADGLRVLIGEIVDEITEIPLNRDGKQVLRIDFSRRGEVQKYGASGPLKSIVKIVGETPPTPPKNRAVQYALSMVRKNALAIANRELNTKDGIVGTNALDKLYASPSEYKRITNAAFEKFQSDSVVTVRKLFTDGNKTQTVQWFVTGKSLPVERNEVLLGECSN